MESFVKLEDVEKIYPNGAKAVYKFDLDIYKNEFIVLVGPSGCGKTTTLRMIAGLEDITKGNLYINGEYANYKPSKDRKIAIVFQSYALYPQMNVYENMAFPLTVSKFSFPVVAAELKACRDALKILQQADAAELVEALRMAADTKATGVESVAYLRAKWNISRDGAKELVSLGLSEDVAAVKTQLPELCAAMQEKIAEHLRTIEGEHKRVNDNSEYIDEDGNVIFAMRKMDKYEIQEKVFKAAEILDLGPYLNRLPKQLSGGQMQRVALGRAIVKDVPLFMMDEPLSNLDARLRLTMRAEIVKLHKRLNATTIYVTHDQTEAMTMADRMVVMSKGFIQQIDTPERIYNDPCNIFVAKFIGTPPINILDGWYDGKAIRVGNSLSIPLSEEKIAHIGQFYTDLYREFKENLDAYDGSESSKEFILKVLSAMETAGGAAVNVKKKGKIKALIEKVRKLFSKKKEEQPVIDAEKEALAEKTEKLLQYCEGDHPVILGLRPEHVRIEVYNEKKHKDCYRVQPTLVELLGSELHVHFDFEGREMIAKLSAKEHVDENTVLALTVSIDDTFVFDPVSGCRIY